MGQVADEPRVHALIAQRLQAKKAREFDKADELREVLRRECGVELFDKTKFWKVVGGQGHVPLPKDQVRGRPMAQSRSAAEVQRDRAASATASATAPSAAVAAAVVPAPAAAAATAATHLPAPAAPVLAVAPPSKKAAKKLRREEVAAAAEIADRPIASGFGHAMLLKMGWGGQGSALKPGAIAEPLQTGMEYKLDKRGLVAEEDAEDDAHHLQAKAKAASAAIAAARSDGLTLRTARSSSGFLGVRCHEVERKRGSLPGEHKPYRATYHNGESFWTIGSYSTAEEAALAYARTAAEEEAGRTFCGDGTAGGQQKASGQQKAAALDYDGFKRAARPNEPAAAGGTSKREKKEEKQRKRKAEEAEEAAQSVGDAAAAAEMDDIFGGASESGVESSGRSGAKLNSKRKAQLKRRAAREEAEQIAAGTSNFGRGGELAVVD